jgi:hypothetical protein
MMDETQIQDLARKWEAMRLTAEQALKAALEGTGSVDDALLVTRQAGELEIELRCAQVLYACSFQKEISNHG